MRSALFFAFVILFTGIAVKAAPLPRFDRAEFYAVIKKGDKAAINNEIDLVTASDVKEKEAYEGFLLMRKAGLMAIPAEKLKFFKKGRIKLETAIANDADNAEYHFLRFIIEENA